MKITSAKYMASYGFAQPLPEAAVPELVFLGRSNVGKSSLINALLGRKALAKTSNTPGKTRTYNFYLINEAFHFVDVPGYGYAHVSKVERARWREATDQYIAKRDSLSGVIHLIDVRHKPSVDDQHTSKFLSGSNRRVCIVFNKIDKIKRGQINGHIARHLGVLDVRDDFAVVPFSAETGEGRRALWAWIEDCLSL